ncbi:MAG: hypothetical protein AAF376_19115 [Pseudomonadota bacterium]
MSRAAFDDLLDVFLADAGTQARWLSAAPLRAICPNVAVAEIVPTGRSSFAPAAAGDPYRMTLRLKLSGSLWNHGLPDGIAFQGIAIEEGPSTGPSVILHFDTDHGRLSTNMQELSRTVPMGMARPDDPALKEAWLSLKNAFQRPVPPPEIPGFPSRHLGRLEPDRFGRCETELSELPPFTDGKVAVSVEFLGAEDAEALDETLDAFFGAASRLKPEASPALVGSMRDFANAVYRDPDGPPVEGPTRDDVFEHMLGLQDASAIWDHVQIRNIHITRRGDPEGPHHQRIPNGSIYIVLGGNCDWEVEHGVSLVWKGGKTLTHVGQDDGYLGPPE